MRIRWLGHACFEIVTSSALTIITDPPDAAVGYPPVQSKADLVLVSHAHSDHSAVNLLPGAPHIVSNPGEGQWKGITFKGIASFHDDQNGRLRGNNTIFAFVADGIRLCHLGDLGHNLTASQIDGIGPVDVLMIPVGGYYTIDARVARDVVQTIHPRLILPMHYKTAALARNFPISDAGEFLRFFDQVIEQEVLEVDRQSLPPGMRLVVLSYPRKED